MSMGKFKDRGQQVMQGWGMVGAGGEAIGGCPPASRTQADTLGLLSTDRVLHAAQLAPILFLGWAALGEGPGGCPPPGGPGGPQPGQEPASFCCHMLMPTCKGGKYPSCTACRFSGCQPPPSI